MAHPVEITTDEPAVTLDTAMSPSSTDGLTGTISGTVRSSSGGRLGGATVSLTGEGIDLSTTSLTSDPVGSYELTGVPAGAYTLTFSHEAHGSVAVPVSIDAETTAPTRNATLPATIVTGSVLAMTGNGAAPLQGATVDVNGVEVATTGSAGGYSVTAAAPGEMTLRYSATGYRTETMTVTPVVGQTSTVSDVVLFPLVEVTGRMVDVMGRRVRGSGTATVAATSVTPRQGLSDVSLASIRWTGGVAGAYTIDDVPAPATYTLELELPAHQTYSDTFEGIHPLTHSFSRNVPAGGPGSVDTVVPFAGRVVYGTFSCGNTPAANLDMGLGFYTEGFEVERMATTDGQGRISFARLDQDGDFRYINVLDENGGIDFSYPQVTVFVTADAVDASMTGMCQD